MKKIARAFVAVTIAASAAGGASASGPVVVEPITVAEVAAPASDWSGFYAGGFLGRASGDMMDIGGPYVLNSDNHIAGLMLGYRRDLGSYVVGGELSSTFSVDLYQAAFPTWAFDRVTDLRLSVGRDMGRALIYVAGGYTNTGFSVGATNYIYDGWNLGVGVDYMATERVMVGIEYVHRSVARTTLSSWNADFGTLQLRVAMRF